LECKQLSSHNAQTYENLIENPKLYKLESQLQEVKYEDEKLQMQLKALSPVERMKRSHEQGMAQQQIHTIQSKVMEVTQRLQSVQYKACHLFTEVESRGAELEQVMSAAEQCLEGPVNDALIQEFIEQETVAQQQIEAGQGIRGRIDHTRVTRDESQVSVGGLLALDQVLGDTWSCLTIFGTSIACRRWSAR
jgi:flagella basal body P-ring formation protein FlgA